MNTHPFKVDYLFSSPLAEIRMADPEPLTRSLTKLFLDKTTRGTEYQATYQRDTQHGELFESRFDLFYWDDPPVKELFKFCHAATTELLKRVSDYSGDEFERLKFSYHSWFHVTRKGGFQGLHFHQNASWSGIFCVDPGDRPADAPYSGLVRFHDPRHTAAYYSDAGNRRLVPQAHIGSIDIHHESGKLLLFPSYLMHEIFPYVGETPRIVVAFNCWINFDEQSHP